MKKTGVVIQARMGSTRLPEKVLMKIYEEKTVLEYMVDRVKKASLIDEVIVATTENFQDEKIYEFCKSKGISCFRGSENDVLSRYYECSKLHDLDIVVRLTADCPLVNPQDIDKCVEKQLEKDFDYFANACPPDQSKYPDGSDVEVFTFRCLEKAHIEAIRPEDREHVTFYMWQNTDKFNVGILESHDDKSGYRYTVDYQEDLEVVSFIVKEIEKRKISGSVDQICEILDNNKSVSNLNNHYFAGIGWKK